ncbi:lytic transglycosylase domain-containing protein [Citromicrobium sp. WPS32]|uniref:lytic transglycosylase domain-containing protein n=1 Tax=Citromicrobium sp. WPS32 TaxID=1634517 RepID=UPI000B23F8AD|nr:lytic transglycosylase domain-containing protein [Citromicrobium sp. WPS32]|tara:strand:- start:2489 stop:3127 length:639 start_codon:yes stop_codon:yes gene_type:complete
MILGTTGRLAIFASLTLLSAPARADVMEIGENGARWIAGQQAGMPAGDLSMTPAQLAALDGEAVLEDVPAHVTSDPRVTARAVPDTYKAKVAELAARFDLSPSLIEALVWQESRWRVDARSPVGARGLAQLMPGTARDLGVNPDDPLANLEGGARYLREQLDRFDGDLEKALAAYNAGPGRVIRANGVPRIRETQAYVAAIMGRLSNHSRND